MSTIKEYKERDLEFYFKEDISPKPDDDDYKVHIHGVCELYCFITGDAEYVVEGNVYPLRPNSILLMRPGELHHIRIKSDAPYKRFVIWFSPEYFVNKEFSDSLLTPYNERSLGKRNLYTDDMFDAFKPSDCLEHLGNVDIDKNHESAFFRSYLTMALESILESFLTFVPNNGSKLRINKAVKYINSHLSEPITIEELCSVAKLSKAQLNRVFKDETKMTVGQYITAKRMFLARSLINSGMKATEVSFRCGYNDYSAFYRMYKKYFSSIPSEKL